MIFWSLFPDQNRTGQCLNNLPLILRLQQTKKFVSLQVSLNIILIIPKITSPIFHTCRPLNFCHCIESSDIVLARAGYSTIMDMYVLGKKALIIPTPGQTEQIYLARHNSGNGLFLEFNPETDSLSDSIAKLLSEPYTPLAKQENTIDTLIRHLRNK
jgi:UDP-N-acetylglucosamine:LPS N-acetylglucosamine transferase